MPKRPTFWIHRTKRFWFGLAILITLVAGTLLTLHNGTQITFITEKPVGPGTDSLPRFAASHFKLGFEEGGLRLENYSSRGPISYAIVTGWTIEPATNHTFRTVPYLRHESESFPNPDDSTNTKALFIPGTLPIFLMSILWPLWLHRADKKEIALYESEDDTPQ